MKKNRIVLILIALLAMGTAMAQTDSTTTGRKRVAVVLSGGGAKGMAHIGVLKVLERAGIPVDIVTGTSMGSIIGGLYAIGYNANALDSLVRIQDWGYVISDRENLTNQSLSDRRKQNTYLISRELTFGKKDVNTAGIITGKNLAELFQKLCVGYTDSLDFSHDLPIPFSCVATNIIDNSEVDFHSGYLAKAMRASMAIPAAFSPVRVGDMVLVDGGLKNNYPADIAREMGADIIIGVTVQGPPKTAEDLSSTMSIIGQVVDVNCKNKLEENLTITDLHMAVDTKGYNAASFSQSAIDTLIRRGEEEAMRHWDQIMALKRRIGVSDDFRPVILRPLRPQVLTEKRHVTGFTFENMTPQDERFIRQKFHLSKLDSIDAALEQQLTTTIRMDLFYRTAECRLVPDGDGVRVVLVAGDHKTMQLYAGIRFDTEEYATLQLGADIPWKTSVPMSTELTVRLGKRIMARAEITGHPRYFTRPKLSYTFYRNDIDVYVNGDRDYNMRYNQSQAELTPLNFDLRHFNLQFGVRWDYLHYSSGLGSEASIKMVFKNEHFISYRGRVNYNSEDNWYFPTHGVRFKAEYAYVTNNFVEFNAYADDGTKTGKTKGMSEISANWRASLTIGKRLTLQPMAYGRLLFGSRVPTVLSNTIGGDWFGHYVEQQMPFAGIGRIESVDKQFFALQMQGQYRIGDKHYTLLKVAFGQNADKVKNLLDHRALFGVQAAYYYNTILGPLGASLGYSNHTKSAYFFINLGYVF